MTKESAGREPDRAEPENRSVNEKPTKTGSGVPSMRVVTGFSRLCRDRPDSGGNNRTNRPQLQKTSGILNPEFAFDVLDTQTLQISRCRPNLGRINSDDQILPGLPGWVSDTVPHDN